MVDKFDVILLQQQKQLTKQDQVLLQDQEMANFFMLRPIANLESFTISVLNQNGKNIPQKYGYYDINDGLHKKPPEELLKEAKFNNVLFDDSYKSFVRKHGKFLFPDNLTKEEIIKDINMWERSLRTLFGNNHNFPLGDVMETFEAVKYSLNGNGAGFKNLENLDNYHMTEQQRLDSMNSLMQIGVSTGHTVNRMIGGVKRAIDSGKTYKVMAKINMSYRDNPNFRHLWDQNYYYEDEK